MQSGEGPLHPLVYSWSRTKTESSAHTLRACQAYHTQKFGLEEINSSTGTRAGYKGGFFVKHFGNVHTLSIVWGTLPTSD